MGLIIELVPSSLVAVGIVAEGPPEGRGMLFEATRRVWCCAGRARTHASLLVPSGMTPDVGPERDPEVAHEYVQVP